jgi:peptide/nickel transport system permease protein
MTLRTIPSSKSELVHGFIHSKIGLIGIALLLILVTVSIYTITSIPLSSFREWNNPNYWVDYPASAAPAWTNTGVSGWKAPLHTILSSKSNIISTTEDTYKGISITSQSYTIKFDYDSYPTDFMIPYSVRYGDIPPVLEIDVIRPDKKDFKIYYSSLPSNELSGQGEVGKQEQLNEYSSRIFSTDRSISKNLRQYSSLFQYPQDVTRPEIMIFSDTEQKEVLKGIYIFKLTFYFFDSDDYIEETRIVLGGTVYGLLGTDAFRRDLAIGLLWGTPVALFIGLTVSISTSLIGLIYGIIAGYKGKGIDEALMRVNDLFISLPVFILLILLSIRFGLNIFLIVIFLIIFGWAGSAKVARSLALQIKNLQYVEASKLMGESDVRIIFRHIVPQLLPLTFATVAFAVPGAILTEAGLSFLGLSDPSIPSWGRILHEAYTANATALGLWWWIIPPGIMIALTGLSFALIGYTIEQILNPIRRFR